MYLNGVHSEKGQVKAVYRDNDLAYSTPQISMPTPASLKNHTVSNLDAPVTTRNTPVKLRQATTSVSQFLAHVILGNTAEWKALEVFQGTNSEPIHFPPTNSKSQILYGCQMARNHVHTDLIRRMLRYYDHPGAGQLRIRSCDFASLACHGSTIVPPWHARDAKLGKIARAPHKHTVHTVTAGCTLCTGIGRSIEAAGGRGERSVATFSDVVNWFPFVIPLKRTQELPRRSPPPCSTQLKSLVDLPHCCTRIVRKRSWIQNSGRLHARE